MSADNKELNNVGSLLPLGGGDVKLPAVEEAYKAAQLKLQGVAVYGDLHDLSSVVQANQINRANSEYRAAESKQAQAYHDLHPDAPSFGVKSDGSGFLVVGPFTAKLAKESRHEKNLGIM